MVTRISIVIVLVIGIVVPVDAVENVTFRDVTAGVGDLTLIGRLEKPKGEGPFPAVVLLHGCRGITPSYDAWMERLVNWGYVTLQLDSFGPRGVSNDCGRPPQVPLEMRVQDAHAAKSFLRTLPYVDGNRIAVMGWSYGGVTTLSAVTDWGRGRDRKEPFRAAVAFYPGCREEHASLESPLLVLIGKRDDWTQVERCEAMKKIWLKKQKGHELILKIYPRAHHGFDMEGLNETYRGHRMQYDPEAAADAIDQVRTFLAKHFQ